MAPTTAHKRKGQAAPRTGKAAPGSARDAKLPGFQHYLVLFTDLLLVVWLAVVARAYLMLVVAPFNHPKEEVPGVMEMEPLVLPLLLSLVTAAIIRYFCLRSPGLEAEPQASVPPVEGQDHL